MIIINIYFIIDIITNNVFNNDKFQFGLCKLKIDCQYKCVQKRLQSSNARGRNSIFTLRVMATDRKLSVRKHDLID